MPKLEEATGMSGSQCQQWLEERKLQYNTTNLFRYMQWVSSRDKNPMEMTVERKLVKKFDKENNFHFGCSNPNCS